MFQTYQKPLSGKSIGIVFGSFAPLHQGHLDIIMRAKKENDGGCLVVVCGIDGDKGEAVGLPLKRRYRYVREFFADDDLVAVCAINDTELGVPHYPKGWGRWLEEFFRLEKIFVTDAPHTQRRWYVGDAEYALNLTDNNETVILLNRSDNPISSGEIRKKPITNWNKITRPFKRAFSKNILVVGTASEGKTTLVKDLGKYFNAPYSHEWARDYMKNSCVDDNELDGTDYLAFLEGQYNLNRSLVNSAANHGVFFSDTDSMVTRMYAEYYAYDDSCALTPAEFDKVAVAADEYTRKSRWDRIFLISPHNAYVDDHVRCMAHAEENVRNIFYNMLCDNIKRAGFWDKTTVLTGNYYENFVVIREYVKGIFGDLPITIRMENEE